MNSDNPAHPEIAQALARLQSDIEKLKLLAHAPDQRGWEAARTLFLDQADVWLLRHNMALGAAPIDFLLEGRTDAVKTCKL